MTPVLTRTMTRSLGIPEPAWHLRSADAESGIRSTGASGDEAGPVDDGAGLPAPPELALHPLRASLGFTFREGDLAFRSARRHGEVFRSEFLGGPGKVVMISNPAHIASIMGKPDLAPSATRFSPLRPIVGPDSVLTSVGPRHKQQRGLLLPQFHGRAVTAYQERIDEATARRIDEWRPGETVALADIGQAITLDVIMSAVFGIEDAVRATPSESAVRSSMIRLLQLSTHSLATVVQLINSRSREPRGVLKMVLNPLDRAIYGVIAERRREGADGPDGAGRTDILTVLMAARGDDGEPLGDGEIRDELLTLVLAGHETTSNTVAWTFERLTRTPDVYARAMEAARSGDDAYVEALINESMRSRPVVPVVARELLAPWRFGEYAVERGRITLVSILLLHHRDDLYPRPFAFEPERFLGVKPSPQRLMPFGGGTRRCLGAGLALAELRVVISEILRRTDLAITDAPPERPQHRNVTMIPADGGLVRATVRR
ncbi:cytochrome P450 [Tsukamurella sp. 1534]|uniref:cytochrome P450 n=1 Tax=Tsukamurella sp. 1534 TaxID=1151061 RepID=UPI000A33D0C6|nr:cytochrome P450 [Tsukamurella sp. 1534]